MADPGILIFLTSGLFLGWSLGANDAANVFGTAVGSAVHVDAGTYYVNGYFVDNSEIEHALESGQIKIHSKIIN